jgi:hypothetical protein
LGLNKVDSITFTIKNNESRNIEIFVRFNAGYNNQQLSSYVIPAGETKEIILKDISGYGGSFKYLSTAKLQLYISNSMTNASQSVQLASPANFTISNVSYNMIKEG